MFTKVTKLLLGYVYHQGMGTGAAANLFKNFQKQIGTQKGQFDEKKGQNLFYCEI